MKVVDEFMCRRCCHTFRSFPMELADGDTLEDHVRETHSTQHDFEDRSHTCYYGGIGIGDWIGSVEVKDTSET